MAPLDANRFAEEAWVAWSARFGEVGEEERDGKSTVALRGSRGAMLRLETHDAFVLAVAATVVLRQMLPRRYRHACVERIVDALLAG